MTGDKAQAERDYEQSLDRLIEARGLAAPDTIVVGWATVIVTLDTSEDASDYLVVDAMGQPHHSLVGMLRVAERLVLSDDD